MKNRPDVLSEPKDDLLRDTIDSLTELITKKYHTGYWKVFQNGVTFIKADTGMEFLNSILTKNNDNFEIFKDGKGFAIQNYHDLSTGYVWYDVQPCAYSTYMKRKG